MKLTHVQNNIETVSEEKNNKLRHIREEVTNKVKQEQIETQKQESVIEKMEREELMLIESLQKTQSMQKMAYSQLEETLNQSRLLRGSSSFSDNSSITSSER